MNAITPALPTRFPAPSCAPERASGQPRAEGAPGAKRPAGLVTCAITVRAKKPPQKSAGQRHFFASKEELVAAAARVGPLVWSGAEGPQPRIEVGPGLIRLTAPDLGRREKSAERQRRRETLDADLAAAELARRRDGHETVEKMGPDLPQRVITGWSRKSRARMVATLAELDLAPLLLSLEAPAMVTLTYPGRWEPLAPNGATAKKHLLAFFKRYERAWGTRWKGIWKMEFQRRGAPHFHLLMVPPTGTAGEHRRAEYESAMADWEGGGKQGRKPRMHACIGDGLPFRKWLSLAWADIVGAEGDERIRHISAGTAVDYKEGDRARDPKRAAVYFGKHGSFAAKDYQHKVPDVWLKGQQSCRHSVGRFWGYRGLEKVRGAATLTFDEMIFLGRILRKMTTRTRVWDSEKRVHTFRPVLRTEMRPRGRVIVVRDEHGEVVDAYRKMRRQTVRARRMTGKNGTGFALVNDGIATLDQLRRALEVCHRTEMAPAVGLRGPISERFL